MLDVTCCLLTVLENAFNLTIARGSTLCVSWLRLSLLSVCPLREVFDLDVPSFLVFTIAFLLPLCVTAKRKERRKAEENTRKEGEHLETNLRRR